MRGTPRSIWLSWANRTAGWWIGTATTEARRQQRVVLNKIAKPTQSQDTPQAPNGLGALVDRRRIQRDGAGAGRGEAHDRTFILRPWRPERAHRPRAPGSSIG